MRNAVFVLGLMAAAPAMATLASVVAGKRPGHVNSQDSGAQRK